MNDNVKRLTKKIAVIMLGAMLLFACAAFTACGGTGDGSAEGAYTVSFYENDGSTLIAEEQVFPGGSVSAWRLDEIKPTTPKGYPEDKYVFAGWGTVENVREDLRLVAQYVRPTYAYSFYEEDGETLIGEPVSVLRGEGVKESDVASHAPAEKEGVQFKGWNLPEKATGDLKLVAEYGPITHTVDFYYEDGVKIGSLAVEHGSDVKDADLADIIAAFDEKANGAYYLDGWSDVLTNVTADKSVTAVKGNLYKIVFKADGAIAGSESTELAVFYVKEGEGIAAARISAITVPEKTGYVFNGWGFTEITNVTANATYTATYSVKTYSVKFYDYTGDLVHTETVEHGAGVTADELAVVPHGADKEGYTFNGWGYTVINNVICDINVIAQYKINEYTVRFYRENGETVAATVQVSHGGSVSASSMPAPETKNGFTFAGWVDKTSGAAVSLTGITSDLDVKESYTSNLYAVRFLVNGTAVYTANVEYGKTLTAEQIAEATVEAKAVTDDEASSGYKFGSWPSEIESAEIKSNANVNAVLAKKMYTVTFRYGDEVKEVEVFYQEKVTASDLEDANALAVDATEATKAGTGKKFKCWNVADGAILAATVTKDVTYTAQIVAFYNVTFEGETDGSAAATIEVFTGEKVTSAQFEKVTPAEKTGCDFDYWTSDGTTEVTTEQILAATVTENVTYKPVYKTKKLTVTFYKGIADNSTVYQTVVVDYGGNITKDQMPGWTSVDGKTFRYWASTRENQYDESNPDKELTNKVTSLENITDNMSIYAVTDVVVYSVTFKGDGKTDYPVTVEYGTSVSADDLDKAKTALAKDGYNLDYFTTDGTAKVDDSVITATAVTADGTVYVAKYTKLHTLTFVDYDGTSLGTATVRDGEYIKESEWNALTSKAKTSRTGYTFTAFESGSVTLSTTTAISADMNFTATYTINQYKVTFKVLDKSGNVLKSVEKSYDYNTTIDSDTLKAIGKSGDLAIPGYTFDYWTKTACRIDGSTTNEELFSSTTSVTVPANDDTVLYGVYKANKYQIKFADANGNVVDSMTETVTYNTVVELSKLTDKGGIDAVQKEGHSFDYWTLNGAKIDDDFTFTDTEDVTLVPVYKINKYTVTFCKVSGGTIGYTITKNFGEEITSTELENAGELDAVQWNGYIFKGWTTSLGGKECITSLKVPANNDTMLYPVYYVNVTFTVNGETVYTDKVDVGEKLSSEQIEYATVKAKDRAAEISYDFDGWSENVNSAINEPITVTAKITELWTVTFMNTKEDNDSTEEIKTYKVRNGESLSGGSNKVTELTKGSRSNTDYKFIGWSLKVNEGAVLSDEAVLGASVTEDVTYYAAFEKKVEYYVQIYVQGYEYSKYGVANDEFKSYFPYSTYEYVTDSAGNQVLSFSDYDVADIRTRIVYSDKTEEFNGLVAENTGNFVGYTTDASDNARLKFKGFEGDEVDLSDFTNALPEQYKKVANTSTTIKEGNLLTYNLDVNEDELGLDLEDAFYAMSWNYPNDPVICGLTRDPETGIVGFKYDLSKKQITGDRRQAGIRLEDNAAELYEDVIVKFTYKTDDVLYVYLNSAKSYGGDYGEINKGTSRSATSVWKTDVISLKSLATSANVTDWRSLNFTTNSYDSGEPQLDQNGNEQYDSNGNLITYHYAHAYELIIESITYIEKGENTYSGKKLLDITAPSYTSGQGNANNVSSEKVELINDGTTDVVRYTYSGSSSSSASPVHGMLINLGNLNKSNYSSIKVTFKASKKINVYLNGYKSASSGKDNTYDLLDIYYYQERSTGSGISIIPTSFNGTQVKYIYLGSESADSGFWIDLYSIELVAKSYTITYNGADSASYPYGTKLSDDELEKYSASAETGKEFVGWATTEDATADQVLKGGEYIVTEVATLYPVFKTAVYTVTFKDGKNELKSQQVEHGSTPAAPSPPSKPGYNFIGWTKDGDSSGTVYSSDDVATHQITASVTYVAKYLQIVTPPTIESKTYNGSLQTAVVKKSEFYDVTTNNGGTDVGSYDVVLTIKDQSNFTFDDGFTKTLVFTITKASATFSGMPASIANTYCGIIPTIEGVTANGGSAVTFVYATSADGPYAADTAIKAGTTMYVKAYAEATDNYEEGYSEALSFTVVHNYKWIPNDDNTQDVHKCACGYSDGKVYNKVVTATNELLMKEGETLEISLEGIEYSTVISLSYGATTLDAESMTITAEAAWISGTHGVQNFTAVVKGKDDAEHTVTVPVTFITDVVTDWSTFLHTFQSHTGNYADGVFGEGKYYVLGCDIEAGSLESHVYEGDTYKRITAVPDTEAENYIWWTDIDGVVNGFAGVLDGRGHVITNIVADTGIFGVMKGGTVKNIDFTVSDWTVNYSAASLFGPLFNVTLENVNITFNKAMELATNNVDGTFGIITGQHGLGNTFKDINVYAPGSTLDCLVMQSGLSTGNGVKSSTFENINFYAKSFERFGSGISPEDMAEKVPGVKFSAVDDYDVTAITLDASGGNVAVTKPSQFSTYNLKAIRYNDANILATNGKLDTGAFLGAVKYTAGTYVAFMTLVKDGHEIRLPINLTFDGVDIEEIVVVETETSVAITLPELFKNYEITDIVTAGGTSVIADGKIGVSALASAVGTTRGSITLTVTLKKDGGAPLEINVDALFATGVVTDWVTFLHTFQSHSGNNSGFFGENTYYILGSDIEAGEVYSHTYNGTSYIKAGPVDGYIDSTHKPTYGFAGTLDGRGYAIVGVKGTYQGLFGIMNGATIKNIDFTISDWDDNFSSSSLLGPMADCTIENVNITFEKTFGSDKMSGHGVITGQQALGNTFKNINVYAPGSELTYLVGQGGTLAGNGNTYTDINFYVKSYTYTLFTSTSTTGITAVSGVNSYDVSSVYVGAQGEDVTVTKPDTFSDYTLKALRYGNVSLLTSDNKLDGKAFLAAIKFASGTHTAFMTLENGGHVIRLPINVTFEGLDIEDIFVEADSAESSVAIDLPTIFADYTVSDITANGTPVMINGGMLDKAEFAKVVALGTKQALVITLTKDGTSLEMTVNATYVSEVITSWAQLLYRVQYRSGVGSNFGEGKYYVLGNDIVGGRTTDKTTYNGDSWYGSTTTASGTNAELDTWTVTGGFRGTLDGLGHTISNISFGDFSMFGSLSGGTLKNINLSGVLGSNAWGIFGGGADLDGATIQDVTVTFTSGSCTDLTASTGYNKNTGFLTGGQLTRSTIKNLTVHAEGIKIKNLISGGGHINNTKVTANTFENVNIYCADYINVSGSVGQFTSSGLQYYRDVQTIILTGETVSVDLMPSGLVDSQYKAYKVMLNGKEITEGTIADNSAKFGGTSYNAIDYTQLSVAQIMEAIGEDFEGKEFEFKYTLAQDTWNYGYPDKIIVRVKFTKPAE